MSKTKTLITSKHPKGRHSIELCRIAYNKAGLDEERVALSLFAPVVFLNHRLLRSKTRRRIIKKALISLFNPI